MHKRTYILFLALIATAPPLATDMYLSAIPRIAEEWGVARSTVNLSLVLWFAAYSPALLMWGTLSDRYGRRPILITGLTGFVLSSVFCALSQDVYQFIGARILQGITAAGASSMVMAIARDAFEGKERQLVLAWIGIILGVAPMVAPSVGAALLEYAQWRTIFTVQAALAVVSLAFTLTIYKETAVLDDAGFGALFSRYGRLLRNTRYVLANGTTGLLAAPYFGFIGFSATAYIVHFGMSEQQFGILFGVNSLCAITGAAACTRLIRRYHEYRLLTVTFVGGLIGGVLLLVTGYGAWYLFAFGMGIYTFFSGMNRPLVNHLVLEQVDRDIGAAASGVVCYQFVAGAAGMALATCEWSHPFLVFGVLAAVCPAVVLAAWPLLLKRIRHRAEDHTIDEASLEAGAEEKAGG